MGFSTSKRRFKKTGWMKFSKLVQHLSKGDVVKIAFRPKKKWKFDFDHYGIIIDVDGDNTTFCHVWAKPGSSGGYYGGYNGYYSGPSNRYSGRYSGQYYGSSGGGNGYHVLIENLKDFAKDKNMRVDNSYDASADHVYSPDEIEERCRSFIGDFQFKMFTRNCETFAKYCRNGDWQSNQTLYNSKYWD